MKRQIRNLWFLTVFFIFGFLFFIHGPVGILKVTSGSMEPALEVGDFCFINKNSDFLTLQVGEMVVFYYGDNNKACHRIIERREDGYVTKGDANPAPDVFLLTRENYYGKVFFTI